jgi:PhnB protein
MVGEEMPGGVDQSPKTPGGSPVGLFVYVEDVDDVFGRRWNTATHVEDVPPDEMERRAAEVMGVA